MTKTGSEFIYEKLSLDEQKKRQILGRLTGIIADSKNPTRNGRKYSAKLWENVFNNPIMQEKIKNRCCFGELCHPADRTEVDLEKIAICLAETPKMNSQGQLLGVFDILNTPNGRILKTLCDYGCKIGISSRGQGDLITDDQGDEAVDPDTYECECFDAVVVPAVESARLQYVTEGLSTGKKSLKAALLESLAAASSEDKKVMEETLDELKIDVKEKEEVDPEAEAREYKEGAEAFLKQIETTMTPEEASRYYFDEFGFDKTAPSDEIEERICAALIKKGGIKESLEEAKEEVTEEEVEETIPEDEAAEVELEVGAVPEETVEPVEDPKEEEIPDDFEGQMDLLKKDEDEAIDAYEKVIDKVEDEHVATELEHIKDEEEAHAEFLDAVKEDPSIDYEHPEEEKVEETETVEETEEVEEPEEEALEEGVKEECNSESCTDKDEPKEEGKKIEEAVDNGDQEFVKNLQEALKRKATLEQDVRNLQEKLAVSDTKVNELLEEAERYKKAVARLATLSKTNQSLKESVSKLEGEVKEKDSIIESQKVRIARLAKGRKESVSESLALSESFHAKENELVSLNENLTKANTEINSLKAEIASKDNSVKELNENLTKATSLKEAYKKLANEAVNRYIDIRAKNLGLTDKDIKRKLGESYTLQDIDQVCEDLKSYQLNVSRLPFSIDRKVGVKVNEGRSPLPTRQKTIVNDDDEVDESLIKLANLR